MSIEYNAGFDAYEQGALLSDNPYTTAIARSNWEYGWRSAHKFLHN